MDMYFLKSEKLSLKPVESEDYPLFYYCWNNPEIRENLALRFPVDENEISERIKKGVYFTILYDSEKVGYIALKDLNQLNQRAYLEVVITEGCRNQGLGTDAIKTVLKYAFQELNLHKVLLEVYDFNEPALEVYKKIGFVLEGRLRKNSFKRGQFHDLLIMGILREEFQEG
ncbi:MAG: Spermidine N(1)-acetyltransferase [candidate division WS2 bacterium]|nr:Spermidine N(1)-acetyltransferase [Candidatus Lithacetigena glycinireducens]